MFFRKNYNRLKAVNYARVQEQWEQRSEYCPGLPVRLWVNTSDICNLNCIMCGRYQEPPAPARPGKLLDRKIFDALVRDCFASLIILDFSLTGEATVSPYFPQEVAAARAYGVRARLNTNGMLLGTDALLSLVLSKVQTVSVSIDGAAKETFEAIRRGADFSVFTANLHRFHQARRDIYPLRRPSLEFSVVIMKKNIKELPAILNLISQWEPEGVTVQYMTPVYPFMEHEYLKNYPELSDHYINLAREEARRLGLSVHFPPLWKEQPESPGGDEVTCSIPWTQSLVLEDGRVTTCCKMEQEPICGDLKQQSFAEIWNGPVYRAIRRGLAQGEPHPVCRRCYWKSQGLPVESLEGFIA